MVKKVIILSILPLMLVSSCSETRQYFTVTWKNDDGSILEVDENVKRNDYPHYDGDKPTKEDDETYSYEFLDWDPKLSRVTKDISYNATYTKIKKDVEVVPTHQSGFYDSSFLLCLTTDPDYDIYYTLDNSVPTRESTKYTEPILIDDVSSNPNVYSIHTGISSLDVFYPSTLVDKCNNVCAIAIKHDSEECSKILNLSYFVGYNLKTEYQNLPIITLTINDDDLFDYEKGIYVTGKIYDESEHTGYPETWPANYTQKGKSWERLSTLIYFNENKEYEFSQEIGVRIHGGWSRAFNQKSFNLYARKEYDGNSTFKKAFFDDIYAHSLMLRSGGYRDTALTKVRDSLNHDMSVNEKFDVQRSKQCVVFLNGEYWGVYNLQERFSDNYVSEHHDIDKKNDLIIQNDEVDEGEESDYHYYTELREFFENNDLSLPSIYEEASHYIDFEEFAEYMSTQIYVGNIDWPGNNVRLWKDISNSESKWHFMMYDTDDSSDILPSKCAPDTDSFLPAAHWKSGPLESDCILGLMLSKLITNATFRALFRTTFQRIMIENFASSRVNSYLDAKVSLLSNIMAKDYARYVSDSYDSTYFVNKVDVIKNFFQRRSFYIMDYFDLHVGE